MVLKKFFFDKLQFLLTNYNWNKRISENKYYSNNIKQYYKNYNKNLKQILINHIKQYYSYIININ